MKRNCIIIFILSLIVMSCNSGYKGDDTIVEIETDYGKIKVRLYSETPLHRDSFLRMITDSAYTGFLIHRVDRDFVIQAGDAIPDSATATIRPEIDGAYPKYFHKYGALAAPRWGDERNPSKESEGNQFYIVTGTKYTDYTLKTLEEKRVEDYEENIYNKLVKENKDTIDILYARNDKEALSALDNQLTAQAKEEADAKKGSLLFTDEQKETYKSIGGTPFLDGEYTVFGEVIEGMDVVEKIQKVKVDDKDRPLKDIKLKMSVIQ